MADEERRITARMILDSTGFNASLQGVNNNLRVAQSELRNASAQVGVFGRDSERLQGIQEALSSQLQLHTQRVGIYTQSLETTTARMNGNITERDRLRTSLASANSAYDEAVRLLGRESDEATQAGQAVSRLTEDLSRSELAVQTNARQINTYTTQLNNAQAELARTQALLNSTNREIATQESSWLSASRTLNSASEQMRTSGEKISKAGQSLTVGVTMPIVGIGVAAANSGMEFEAQMSRVKAISGATEDEFKQLNDQALKLGADTTFSSKQAAEGMENLASAGFKTTEIMSAMPGMLDLAASGGLDIATSSDIAASSLRGFGLEATQSSHVADVLAKAAADTNAEVTDMGAALKYAAPPAHTLGMSIEETAAAIGIMSNAGIKGEMAGTTLRGSLISLASPSADAAKTMAQMGFNAFDAQGKMLPFKDVIDRLQKSTRNLSDEKKADALATIFGKESLSGMMVLMDAGPATIDELTKSFKDSDGAAKAMAATMLDNTKGSLEAMKGSIETASIKLSTVLAPTIIKVSENVTEMANKFSELSPATQETIVKSLALVAALGPMVLVTGKVLTAGSAIVGVMGRVAGALGTASVAAEGATATVGAVGTAGGAAALLLNPVTLGIAGVGAAAVGTAYLLNQKVIPTLDLFGKEVSDAAKKSVTAYMELDNKVGVSLLSFKANNTTITQAIASETVGTFEKMGADIKAGRDKHYTEDLANLTKFYQDQGLLSSQDATTALNKMKETHELRSVEIDTYEKIVKEIYEKAANDHRTITQEEENTVKEIKDKMQKLAIEALTESEKEQQAILVRMRLSAKDISTEQASDVIKASAKQRDETTRLANDQYEKTVNSISRQRDEGVITSDDQAQKMIAAAQKIRDESIKKAQEMHKGVVDELESENKDVAEKINEQDGSIKTVWQNLRDWFANTPIVRYIVTSGANASANMNTSIQNQASGTDYFTGGLTTMHEKGYEVYNLPRGSRIYNHEASEDLVLKTAQEVAKGVLSSMQANSRSGNSGPLLHADKIVIANDMDIRDIAYKLEFYREQAAAAKGG